LDGEQLRRTWHALGLVRQDSSNHASEPRPPPQGADEKGCSTALEGGRNRRRSDRQKGEELLVARWARRPQSQVALTEAARGAGPRSKSGRVPLPEVVEQAIAPSASAEQGR